jgi:HEAT repeat protein
MLAIAESPKRIDARWVDRAISLLGVDSVRNSAIFVLGASGQRRALDALHAAAKKEDDAKAATELAERGDPRASPFLTAILLDRKQQREAGWVLEALGKCGDASVVEVIEEWIASRRSKADPDIRFARKAIAALSKKRKKKR